MVQDGTLLVPLLSRIGPVRGLVIPRQTFVRRCHLGWTAQTSDTCAYLLESPPETARRDD
jgi:hypothetical protein